MKSKLTSRKFWACVVGIIIGIATTFGVDESTVATVSGAVVSAASIVAYITGEAFVDASRTCAEENADAKSD